MLENMISCAPSLALLAGSVLCSIQGAWAETIDDAVRVPAKRPNIVLIMVDDMGWSDIGAYGSEIKTPNLDALAKGGIRFTNFYNTAKCFPSRSCLMTGLYAQQAGGYQTSDYRFRNATTLGEVLGSAGYGTYASGKHHGLDNLYDRGFDRYFGLRDGACNHFNPGLKREGEPEPAGKGKTRYWADDGQVFNTRDPGKQSYFPPGFYSTDAFTDKALEYIGSHPLQEKPFFLYLAYTAPHDPIMAWPEDIEKYEGVYEVGYEKIRNARYRRQLESGLISADCHPLTPADFPAWDGLSESKRRTEARRMQVYAAMIDRLDQNIGRLVARLESLGVRDDTLILFCSDNGASAEGTSAGDKDAEIGGMERYASVGGDWANVSNTPLRKYKNDSFEGGIRTPLVANWPNGIVKPGRISPRPGHLIDFMATFLDVAEARYPAKYRDETVFALEGESFAEVLFDAPVPASKPMYFQWQKGRAVIDWPWKIVRENEQKPWELYNLETDGVELEDLSGSHPDRVFSMADRHEKWLAETTRKPPEPGSKKEGAR